MVEGTATMSQRNVARGGAVTHWVPSRASLEGSAPAGPITVQVELTREGWEVWLIERDDHFVCGTLGHARRAAQLLCDDHGPRVS
jgi:hypothetical protein